MSAAQKKTATYYIYRESTLKYYVPQYYGVKTFGKPTIQRAPAVTYPDRFARSDYTLYEYQQNAVNAYLSAAHTVGGGIIHLFTGGGKTKLTMSILSELQVPVIILCQNGGLLKQWVTEIEDSLPNARVGIIQGDRCEIGPDEFDITIAMIQTLTSRKYPSSLFEHIGLIVGDEVHHSSAKQTTALFFTLPPCKTLGLTATFERSDGTLHVINKFFGDIVFEKLDRDISMNVTVLGITYRSTDAEFNRDIYNAAGKICNANMIKKLGEYQPRSEFIIRVLQDSIARDPRQQHALYSHNRNAVELLESIAATNDVKSRGFYYKDMKAPELEKSKNCAVIFASFSKAGEGVNIKTLTTLYFVTPVTNVKQAAGRNQRQVNPSACLIYDFIDTHDKFQKQWAKRRAFYKKEGFTIYEVDSDQYTPHYLQWRCTFNPLAAKRTKCKTDAIDDCGDDDGTDSDVPKFQPRKCMFKNPMAMSSVIVGKK